MALLLMIVGFGWAVLGVGNILLAFSVATLVFNMALFILPGLALGAIGQGLRSRSARARPASPESEP